MEVVILFFIDPDSYHGRREFRGVFASESAAKEYVRREHGKDIDSDGWLRAAYQFRTETVQD